MTQRPDMLKPLTSLRFFAAFWVVLYSYWKELGIGEAPNVIVSGHLGVELFFILSGFILTYTYLENWGEGRFRYGTFVVHRLARIYPLHIATLLFAIVLAGAAGLAGLSVDPNLANWGALPANLFLVQAWGLAPAPAFNHPSWSISAEWLAYLAFPLFAALLWPLRHRPIVAVGIGFAFLTALYVAFEVMAGFSLTHATFQWGALRIIPCFFLGGALYLAYRGGAVSDSRFAGLSAVAALLLMVLASGSQQYEAVIVAASALLVLSLAGADREGRSLMSHPVLVYLGEISFATYMVYVPWKWVYLNAVGRLMPSADGHLPLGLWLFGLVALIPLSMLAHHLVERPFRTLIRRFGEGLLERAALRQGRSIAEQG